MAGIATHESDTDAQIAAISFAASGDNTVIAAVAGKKINIIKLMFVVAGATAIILKNGAVALSGAMSFGTNGGLTEDMDKAVMVLTSGSAFVINSSNAVQVSGFVAYTQRSVSQG